MDRRECFRRAARDATSHKRSHFRHVYSASQQKLSAIISDIPTITTKPSFPVLQTLRDRLGRQLLPDTRQGSCRGLLQGKETLINHDLNSRRSRGLSSVVSHKRMTGSDEGEEVSFGEAELELSSVDELLEPLSPAQLTTQLNAPNLAPGQYCEDHSSHCCAHVGVLGRVATQHGSHDGAAGTPQTTGLGLTNTSSPFHHCASNTMDAQESPSPSSPETDIPERNSRDSGRPFPCRHGALSLFPPVSSSTGNREYTSSTSPTIQAACLFSPMNNGRDTYGNFLPSITRKHSTALPPSCRPTTQPTNKERCFSVTESVSSAGRTHGDGQNNLRSFGKTAGTQVSSQGPARIPLQQALNHEDVAPGVPMVTHAGRPGSRSLPSIRPQSSAAASPTNPRETKKTLDGPFTADTRRNEAGGSDQCLEIPVSIFSTISAGTAGVKPIASQGLGLIFQHDCEVQCAENQQQLHGVTDDGFEEDTKSRQTSQRQNHDQSTAMCVDGGADAYRRSERKPRVVPDLQSTQSSSDASQYIPPCGATPDRYPQKVKHGRKSIGRPSVESASASIPSSGFRKGCQSFHTALSKAGRLSRSLLATTPGNTCKRGSKQHLPDGFKKHARPKTGLGADSNGWPRPYPTDAGEMFSAGFRASKDDYNDEPKKAKSLAEETRAFETALRGRSASDLLPISRTGASAVNIGTIKPDSAISTEPSHARYPRGGSYARPPFPEVTMRAVQGASFSITTTLNQLPVGASGRLLTTFPEYPDRNGFVYVPRDDDDDDDVLSIDSYLEYLYRLQENESLEFDSADETKDMQHYYDVMDVAQQDDTEALLPSLRSDAESIGLTTNYHALNTETIMESASPATTTTAASSLYSRQSLDSSIAHEALLVAASPVSQHGTWFCSSVEDLRSRFNADFMEEKAVDRRAGPKKSRREEYRARQLRLMRSCG